MGLFANMFVVICYLSYTSTQNIELMRVSVTSAEFPLVALCCSSEGSIAHNHDHNVTKSAGG
jgi:hypothetical protein